GTNSQVISGASGLTYTLTTADIGKYIRFRVVPTDQNNTTNTAAVSDFVGSIDSAELPPVASNVIITGITQIGETLTGDYEYSSNTGVPEGATTYQWFRADDGAGSNR